MMNEFQTGDRILVAMSEARFTTLGAGEIAGCARLAESTVRRHLPGLIKAGHVRYTSYVGQWALSGDGRQRAIELRARRAEATA